MTDSHKHFLVIEDDSILRRRIVDALGKQFEGCTVSEAPWITDADTLLDHVHNFDGIVIDNTLRAVDERAGAANPFGPIDKLAKRAGFPDIEWQDYPGASLARACRAGVYGPEQQATPIILFDKTLLEVGEDTGLGKSYREAKRAALENKIQACDPIRLLEGRDFEAMQGLLESMWRQQRADTHREAGEPALSSGERSRSR